MTFDFLFGQCPQGGRLQPAGVCPHLQVVGSGPPRYSPAFRAQPGFSRLSSDYRFESANVISRPVFATCFEQVVNGRASMFPAIQDCSRLQPGLLGCAEKPGFKPAPERQNRLAYRPPSEDGGRGGSAEADLLRCAAGRVAG
jgi:hypothetical protein